MGRSFRQFFHHVLVASLLFTFNLGLAVQPGPGALGDVWKTKVDAALLEEVARGDTGFLIFLSEQADLSNAAAWKTKAEKGRAVFETLKSVAARTQKPILDDLARRGVRRRAFWVANMIWVEGNAELVREMARRADIAHLYADTSTHVDLPTPSEARLPLVPAGVEWNITLTGAPQMWAAGYTGQGVVIGGQDTGYDWEHPALKRQYRGWNGTSANHDYSWHDAIHENDNHTASGNPCGFDSPVPCDDTNHGTHTMGIMVGDDGAGNQVGMAPGAKWIGCRNMEQGWGKPSTYSECYEWFIAPYPPGGDPTQGDPAKAPDVINNSWGCPFAEGCTAMDVLLAVVNSVRAAGILTVHSAGNNGSFCGTVNTPAAIYAESFTVGATDNTDNIASFSSRGPVTVDGSHRLKPDVAAPGVNVRSSLPGGSYGWMSGTSMAAPHVAGLAALLLSYRPLRSGQVDFLENVIQQSAVPRTTTTQDCGDIPGTQVPNNTYGWGRIDALSAMMRMENDFSLNKAAPPNVQAGSEITYTLTITYLGAAGPAHNVVVTDTLPASTTFVRASQPFQLDHHTVSWNFTGLNAGESASVSLVVQALVSSGVISNDQYSVRSDGVFPVPGLPVRTRVRPLVEYSLHFPSVFRARP